ncbi:MAG: Ppx/GppA family phosphatase [Bdellovibrio sp. CG10_big_fil_rev_8_21_14_0_10_47_8]|nr:MAG: Ppx/GppA family phosphatase [Bdellovibrio sp. CG10_big_fil_rev_8_21_14_0_10_47_8]
MKLAALDLGTNSFLCLIAEVKNGKITKIESDEVEIVRLGQGVQQSKKFHPDALSRAEACLQKFRKTIDREKPQQVLAMATSAARDVSNAEALFEIGRKLNIPIEIIPGNREADITFSGAVSAYPDDQKVRAVIDIGGGSTEVIVGNSERVFGGESVDIGGVRLTEMFFSQQPPPVKQVRELIQYIEKKMQPTIEGLVGNLKIDELVAVAGTPTEIAAIIQGGFDRDKIDGFILTQEALEGWRKCLEPLTPQERIEKYGVNPGRADILLAGILILQTTVRLLNFRQVSVSTRGVRHGVILEMFRKISIR